MCLAEQVHRSPGSDNSQTLTAGQVPQPFSQSVSENKVSWQATRLILNLFSGVTFSSGACYNKLIQNVSQQC